MTFLSAEPPKIPTGPALMLGAASPLWAYYAAAAAGGIAFWWMSRWTRHANLEAVLVLPEATAALPEEAEPVGGEAAPVSLFAAAPDATASEPEAPPMEDPAPEEEPPAPEPPPTDAPDPEPGAVVLDAAERPEPARASKKKRKAARRATAKQDA